MIKHGNRSGDVTMVGTTDANQKSRSMFICLTFGFAVAGIFLACIRRVRLRC